MRIDDSEIGLKEMQINVKITITKLENKPVFITHELSGKVYKYIEIKNNIEEENIENGKIQFSLIKNGSMKIKLIQIQSF